MSLSSGILDCQLDKISTRARFASRYDMSSYHVDNRDRLDSGMEHVVKLTAGHACRLALHPKLLCLSQGYLSPACCPRGHAGRA
jgi:hypothetical protein